MSLFDQLKKFDVIPLEIKRKDFDFKNSEEFKTSIFLKELFIKEDLDLDKKYFVYSTKQSLLLFFNKNYIITYQRFNNTTSVFNNNFELLLKFSDSSPIIAGMNWTISSAKFLNFEMNFIDKNSDAISIKTHSKNHNEFHLTSSSEINKISLVSFKENHVKVNFHQSLIQNIFFDYNGNIKSIHLLDRVCDTEYINIKNYKDILLKVSSSIDIYNLCTDHSLKIMNENTFNNHIDFIKNLIFIYNEDLIPNNYQSIQKLIHNINSLKIMNNIFDDSEDFKIKKHLSKSIYSEYKDDDLIFLSALIFNNHTIDSIVNVKIRKEIEKINNLSNKLSEALTGNNIIKNIKTKENEIKHV